MIFNMSGSSGGSANALNFKVVGGTTQPASANENTIWVNTDTDITGWCFSPEDPLEYNENVDEGMVWIQTGEMAGICFNALKKNAMYIYPIRSHQYINGGWSSVAAQSYMNEEWTILASELYLFNAGDTCSEFTGGWTASGDGSVETTLDAASGGSGPTWISYAQVISNNAIDFSQYNTLHINVSSYHSTGTVSVSTTSDGSAVASVTISSATEYTIDISDCDDSYFVKLRTEGTQYNYSGWKSIGFYADKVWLTRE